MSDNPTTQESASADAVTISVIQELLISVVREMRVTFSRSAFSSIINEGHDFSCALLSPEGDLVAQSEDHPGHIFPISYAARAVFERYAGDIHPGDVFLLNDPYICGTHMNDMAMFCPRFFEGRALAFPALRAHWGDVGGSVAGSLSGDASHIFMEGMIVPPIRLYSRGELNRECLEVILKNMRGREDRHGDLMAMLGTCQLAQRRLDEIEERYGRESLQAVNDSLLARAEKRMRAAISALPSGTFHYENYIDNSGTGAEPLRISLRLQIKEDQIHCDFSGTSGQVKGPTNAGPATVATSCFMVLKSLLDPALSVNAGCFRPLTMEAPEGSILNAGFPAPFSGASDVRRTIESCVLGAAVQAMPDLAAGDTKGAANHCYIAGSRPDSGEAFLYYEYPAGGTGALAGSDGDHAIRTYTEGDFNAVQPVESLEATLPLLVEESGLRAGSCGHGEWRGGLGMERRVRLEAGGAGLTVLTDRVIIPPYGVDGGTSGGGNRFTVLRQGSEVEPSDVPGKATAFPLTEGDAVVLRSAGGGGWGDPLARTPEAVLADVRLGYISLEDAREVYGVVVNGGAIDAAATSSARERLRKSRVYLIARLGGEDAYGGSRRLCPMSLGTAKEGGFSEGMLVEYVPARGAPLRAWVKITPGPATGETPLGPVAASILKLQDKERIWLRPIATPYSHPPLAS
ncbi:MAG: hydantoinase B/oxoprolinase family protein [Nitrospinae bacterium]|nr:hydantoinase B/oxoprolinase family protein [Nitrospinota bacterium]